MSDETQLVPHPTAGEPVFATHEQVAAVAKTLQAELTLLRGQISILQSRAAAVDAQLAHIEPMIEARASRTERLVMELQIEMQKLSRSLSSKEKTETVNYAEIKSMLTVLIERTE